MRPVQILYRPLLTDPRIVARRPDWRMLSSRVSRDSFENAVLAYDALVDRWSELFGLSRSDLVADADLEDWSESAVRLVAWVKSGLPVFLLEHSAVRDRLPIASSFNASEPYSALAPSIFSGSIMRFDPLFGRMSAQTPQLVNMVWPAAGRLGAGERYWMSPALLRALNRPCIVSSGNAGGDQGYVASTQALLAQGCHDLLAKIIFQPKYQNPTSLTFAEGSDPTSDRAIQRAFFQAFDVNLLDCEEREQCFLIQERIPMEYEYRVCLVGGKPIAGAGTVEWLSPLFHSRSDGPFDPHVERVRNDRELCREPGLVASYVEMAARLCETTETEAAAHHRRSEFGNCTMDFARNAKTGEICLIETNPLDNFGLYALDFEYLASAIVAEATPETAHSLGAGPDICATNSLTSSAATIPAVSVSLR